MSTRLQILEENLRYCDECDLHKGRTNLVFARGNPEADLMFVGEGPGATEDEEGIPFVGESGQLLDKAIRAMRLDPEDDVYICNAVKCRPPDNRTPTTYEVDKCHPYLSAQIDQVDPRVIVALGKTAARALRLPVRKGWAGQWGIYGSKAIPVMATYHPAYLLRTPSMKKVVGKDLAAVLRKLGR